MQDLVSRAVSDVFLIACSLFRAWHAAAVLLLSGIVLLGWRSNWFHSLYVKWSGGRVWHVRSLTILGFWFALWTLFLLATAGFVATFGFASTEVGLAMCAVSLVVFALSGFGLFGKGLLAFVWGGYTRLLLYTAMAKVFASASLLGPDPIHWLILDRHVGEWTYALFMVSVTFVVAACGNFLLVMLNNHLATGKLKA